MATNFVAGATNLVVLLTDGADDNNVSGGLSGRSAEQPDHQLRHHPEAGRVITVGLGTSTNSEIRSISAA